MHPLTFFILYSALPRFQTWCAADPDTLPAEENFFVNSDDSLPYLVSSAPQDEDLGSSSPVIDDSASFPAAQNSLNAFLDSGHEEDPFSSSISSASPNPDLSSIPIDNNELQQQQQQQQPNLDFLVAGSANCATDATNPGVKKRGEVCLPDDKKTPSTPKIGINELGEELLTPDMVQKLIRNKPYGLHLTTEEDQAWCNKLKPYAVCDSGFWYDRIPRTLFAEYDLLNCEACTFFFSLLFFLFSPVTLLHFLLLSSTSSFACWGQ